MPIMVLCSRACGVRQEDAGFAVWPRKSGGGAGEPRPASEFAQEQLPSDCDSGLALCSGAGIMVGLKFEKSLFTGVK
ncbi:MAG TPA: hypothetical protein DCY79_13675 [Planctomycetaceae bacterium]|nr:hypothetical protein [Planctomycetaceae bacterium]